MQNKNEMTLHDQITAVLELLGDAGFSPGTIDGYSKFFKRLECLASSMGREKLDPELADRFISDTSYKVIINNVQKVWNKNVQML